MGNDDLKNALMRAQGVQGFMGGGMATHAMPDGTVMPGATHADYEAMGYQEGGPAESISPELLERIDRFAGGAPSVMEMTGAAVTPEEMQAIARQQLGAQMTEREGERLAAGRSAGTDLRQLLGAQMTEREGERLAAGRSAGTDLRQLLGAQMTEREGERLDPAQELQEAIQKLEIQKTQTSDPDEIKSLDRLIEVAIVGANAPLREMSLEMQAQGRGEDTALAHLRPGEVILPPEAFEDAQFEDTVARKFEELGIDPEEAVAGVGIASLNPMTGLEEFGFFKKIGKAIKKVAKFIAPIAGPLANFIPGVGPLVAGAIGAATNVVGGKGLSGAISGGLSGYGFGKALSGIGSLGTVGGKVVGSGNFGALGFGDKLAALKTGFGSGNLASAFFNPGKDATGIFGGKIGPGIRQGIGSLTGFGQPMPAVGLDSNNPPEGAAYDPVNQVFLDKVTGKQYIPPQSGNFFSNFISGGGKDGVGNYGMLGDLGAKLVGGSSTSGGLGGLGGLAAAGVPAYMLGKMAYDEAKADKGVALTPLTTMGPTGRYNIEAEIARRMGTQAPNPVEFGLLPQGTFPQLSGGQPMMAAGGGAVYPMAYAEGGNVSVEDFERMNGDINGPGTETSDDVPAMLSDGEFVMTGAAVRGAGGFDMQNQGGILTLTPSGTPDRERGTNVMHEMMDLFGSYANAPA